MNTLAGKTTIVTGASRGQGRAAALALAKAGAQVIVHYGHGTNEAQALVAEIRGIGGRSDAIAVDLSAPDGPHRLARRVRGIVGERLDILVANAGIATGSAVAEMSFEHFSEHFSDHLSEHFALNVRASYFLVQQLLPIMCKGSSVTFLLPSPARAAPERWLSDAAIGGAMKTLVRHLAFALGERGIRVNAVANESEPAVMSAFERRGIALSEQTREERGASAGIGNVIAFLASDQARWITGDIVQVSGDTRFHPNLSRSITSTGIQS